jgi:nucleoside-diphosphate-sugar epimerase
MPAPQAAAAPLRCVVTGAAGFIGSHLVDRLLADGHSVLGLDGFTDTYPRALKERNLAGALAQPRFRLVEADLRTAELAPLLDGADAVLHLAAMGGLVKSWTHFDRYLSCNVLATQRLLAALAGSGVRHLVHVSTSSVYGRDSSGDEERLPRPVSPYGVTKLAAEQLVVAYSEEAGLPFTVLRYFSIYGPRQRPDMGYRQFIDAVLRGEPVTVFGDGRQSRGNTYVDDCVAATVAALTGGPAGTVFNVGGGEVVSALDALALIGRLVGREPVIRFGPPRPGEQRQALADTRRIRAALGWAPTTGIEAGLAAQVAWQRAELALEPAA